MPFGSIRPAQNQVNINSGETESGDAFEAFSRLMQPMLQSSQQTLVDNWLSSAEQTKKPGTPLETAYMNNVQQYGHGFDPRKADMGTALSGMFQRAEDAKKVGNYFGSAYNPVGRMF